MKKLISLGAVAGLLLGLATPVMAEEISGLTDPAQKGRAIADVADRRNQGFEDSKSDMRMVLRNAYGETSERELSFRTLENPSPDDGDKSLIVFSRPRDVAGTALLTYAHLLDPDEQWIYLPSLSRVKRISSANKSGPFMGSEFAYEDFSSAEVGKYSYKWLRNEPCGEAAPEMECFVVERVPLYEKSGYTRQIAWIDNVEFQTRKIDFYDRRNALLKTLTFHGYRLYLDKFWRPAKMSMVNHQSKKETDLLWDAYEFKTGLKDSDFTKNRLKSVR